MPRVGIVAADQAIVAGLERLFARLPGVEIVHVAGAGAQAQAPAVSGAPPPAAAPGPDADAPADPAADLLIVDVWPPSDEQAESMCSEWHGRLPGATVVAVVHRPTARLLARIRRAGAEALWPKGDSRHLPEFAMRLLAQGRQGCLG